MFRVSMIRAFLLAATFAAGLCAGARADIVDDDRSSRHGLEPGAAHDSGAALAHQLARVGTLALAEAPLRYRSTWTARPAPPQYGRRGVHGPHGLPFCPHHIPATRLLFGHGVFAGLLSTPPPQV
ncbi:MAG TPA: hypothetical protein VFZ24_01220 [Longimicrobiales bacterium]